MIISRDKYKKLNRITDDSKDAILEILIPLIEEDYLIIRNKEFERDSQGYIVYPLGSALIANDMLNYRFQLNGNIAFSSENIGDYSYTINSFNGSYPNSIVKRIKRYAGAK